MGLNHMVLYLFSYHDLLASHGIFYLDFTYLD
ncbi:hypothetical protein F383_19438 [Gossypium arboreum]|uniref:Uncharacterized protein n=1 Tax=Gossypium arboreum TaxID=29729 RepID=A0A0B0NEM8_GOSAR|nr:hypothetical protein F383_19438 [Gossypium arboreum]